MVEGITAVVTGVTLLLSFMAVGLPVFVAFLLVNLLAVAYVAGERLGDVPLALLGNLPGGRQRGISIDVAENGRRTMVR